MAAAGLLPLNCSKKMAVYIVLAIVLQLASTWRRRVSASQPITLPYVAGQSQQLDLLHEDDGRPTRYLEICNTERRNSRPPAPEGQVMIQVDETEILRVNAANQPRMREVIDGYDHILVTACFGQDFSYVRHLLNTFNLSRDNRTLLVLVIGDRPIDIPDVLNKDVYQFVFLDEDPPERHDIASIYRHRWIYLKNFLLLTEFKGNVMTLDARDTVLQLMPWQHFPRVEEGFIHLFTEYLTIMDDPVDRDWLSSCTESVLGTAARDSIWSRLSSHGVLNAGQLLARADYFLAFLDEFVKLLINHDTCIDQGMVLLLGYSYIHASRYKFLITPVGRGQVFVANAGHALYRLREDVICNLKDEPFSVIHMWDRLPDLKNIVEREKYLEWPSQLAQMQRTE